MKQTFQGHYSVSEAGLRVHEVRQCPFPCVLAAALGNNNSYHEFVEHGDDYGRQINF